MADLNPQQFPKTSWRDQEIVVEGRKQPLGWMWGGKLYHGSTAELAPGDVVEPGHSRNFKQSAQDAVSVTSDPATARHWAKEANPEQHYVYEVEPLGEVGAHRVKPSVLYEGRTKAAKVVQQVPLDKIVSSDREIVDWQRANGHPRWDRTTPPPWTD